MLATSSTTRRCAADAAGGTKASATPKAKPASLYGIPYSQSSEQQRKYPWPNQVKHHQGGGESKRSFRKEPAAGSSAPSSQTFAARAPTQLEDAQSDRRDGTDEEIRLIRAERRQPTDPRPRRSQREKHERKHAAARCCKRTQNTADRN